MNAPRFFGRQAELARLTALANAGVRLVVVVGPPGAGKSRLARRWFDDEARAVIWVDVAGATDADDVIERVALAVGVPGDPAAVVRALVRSHGWLCLDGVRPGAGQSALFEGWLADAPHLRLAVTTRVRPGIPSEHLVEVGPLSAGPEGDAVALFRARSGALDGIDPAPGPLSELVASLDGLPLTIELAAARSRLMGPAALLQRLRSDRFAVLGGSLRAQLDESFDSLDGPTRRALGALAVFADGAPLDAAQAVLGEGAIEWLQQIRDHSLARADPNDGEPRFRLYRTVRDYAAEQLADVERAAAERAHGAWYAARADQWLDAHMGHDGIRVAKRLERERVDLRAALRRAAAQPHDPRWSDVAQQLARLLHATHSCASFARHEEELGLALGCRAGDPRRLLETRRLRARLMRFRGDAQAAVIEMQAVVRAARPFDDPDLSADTLCEYGRALRSSGAHEQAAAAFDEAALHTHHDPRREGNRLGSVGLLAIQSGRLDAAAIALQSAAAQARRTGDAQRLRVALLNLADVRRQRGDHARARAELEEALAIARAWGHGWSAGYTLVALAELAMLAGDHDAAERGLRDAIEALQRAGDQIHEALAWRALGDLAMARSPDDAATHYATAGALADALDIHSVQVQIATRRPMVPWPPPSIAVALAENERALWRVAGQSSREHAVLTEQRRLLLAAQGEQQAPATAPTEPRVLACVRAYRGEHQPLDPPDLEHRFATLWRRWVDAIAAEIRVGPTDVHLADGRVIDLRARPLLATLLQALVDARVERPGAWVAGVTLIETLWPRAQLVSGSGRARLYNAVAEIRRAGLRPLLQSSRAGYRLDPTRRLRRAD